MEHPQILTAEQFAERRYDLPEGGRWTELVEGQIVVLDPPDEAHGTTVLNLSKALAAWFQRAGEQSAYTCFELGLIVSREPDTVRCPPISCFTQGERFAELENVVTATRPDLVVEVTSTNRRRRTIGGRVEEYQTWGVGTIWVADPTEREIHVFGRDRSNRQLAEDQVLSGEPVLPGFEVPVGDVFAAPEWWLTRSGS